MAEATTTETEETTATLGIADRRLMICAIPARRPGAGFLALLTGEARVTNLPADATIVGVGHDLRTDQMLLLVHSASFDAVPWFNVIPELRLQCEVAPRG